MTLSDPSTEDAVLGSWLAYADQSGPLIAGTAKADHFTGHNAALFRSMLTLFAEGRAVSFLNVANALKADGTLEAIGGGPRLNALTASAVPPGALGDHLPALRELSARRRLHALFTTETPRVATEPLGELLGRVMLTIESIGSDRTQKVHPTTRDLVMEAVKRIEARMSGLEGAVGFTTGMKRLDAVTGGLRRGSQWVLAGPAKGGKSSLALCFLRSLAIANKQRCAFFGLEMPSVENVERLLCSEGNASATHLRDGMLGDRDFAAITAGAAKVAPSPIHFRDDVFDLVQLIGTIRQLTSAHPDLYAVFIDYAQLVSTGVSGASREQEVAGISRTLRQVGMQLNLCIILLSQLNDDGRLRESRALGMDATKIVFIEFTDEPGVRTLRLVQRDGPSDKFDVAYLGDRFQFADLADDHEPSKPAKANPRRYHD